MKYYTKDINLIYNKIKIGEITALLLYGPDTGSVEHAIKALAKTLALPINSAEISRLHSALSNTSLLEEKSIIKIDCPGKFDAYMKDLLLQRWNNFPVIITDELETSNSLRKFFEKEHSLAVIAFYPLEERDTSKLVLEIITKEQKQIDTEAFVYLTTKLKGNRNLILTELEKLLLFCTNHQTIRLEDCINSISDELDADPDLLCTSFAEKNYANFFIELERLKAKSISNIWILRALARFYINLLKVQLLVQDGTDLASAVKSLKPQIFYKIAPKFCQIVKTISNDELVDTLDNLTKAEIEAKLGLEEYSIDLLFMDYIKSHF
ncbi:MAG: DNA polymerase III subunit delta [Rickettsiaceae bacterium]|nr:DNA polymerase III subunit delta [Rickettsiaceae bacterium]